MALEYKFGPVASGSSLSVMRAEVKLDNYTEGGEYLDPARFGFSRLLAVLPLDGIPMTWDPDTKKLKVLQWPAVMNLGYQSGTLVSAVSNASIMFTAVKPGRGLYTVTVDDPEEENVTLDLTLTADPNTGYGEYALVIRPVCSGAEGNPFTSTAASIAAAVNNDPFVSQYFRATPLGTGTGVNLLEISVELGGIDFDGTAATLEFGDGDDDSDVILTAASAGPRGNEINLTIVDYGEDIGEAPATVSVLPDGESIVISLEREMVDVDPPNEDFVSTLVTVADDIVALIEADSSVQATLEWAPVEGDTDSVLEFESNLDGFLGNNVAVELRHDPDILGDGDEYTETFGTAAEGYRVVVHIFEGVTTAGDVVTAIEAAGPSNTVLTVTAGGDGSGLVQRMPLTYLSGGYTGADDIVGVDVGWDGGDGSGLVGTLAKSFLSGGAFPGLPAELDQYDGGEKLDGFVASLLLVGEMQGTPAPAVNESDEWA